MTLTDWDDLRFFLAFARTGSMQAAARALRVNQSTVQRRIALLEQRLSHRLLERHAGGYRLTGLAREICPAAERVEEAVAALARQLASHGQGVAGTLRVTCGSHLASRLQRTPLLARFQERHPGLSVELVISDRFLDLAKGEADIAIRQGAPKDAALVGRKIVEASWSVYASQAYAERYGNPDGQGGLSGHRVIGCDGSIANYPGARWARAVAPPAKVTARSDSWQGLIQSVKAGAGLAAMPRWQGDSDGELVRVIDDIGVTSPYYLLMHRDMRNTPRVRAFADYVASEIRAFRALLLTGIFSND